MYVVSYTFIFSVAGLLYKPINFQSTKSNFRFVIFIPAYKEDSVIVDVASRALEQEYPKACYDVIIIADSLQKETIEKLRQLRITLMIVHFKFSTKVKSLNFALQNLTSNYDYAVILDADNIMYSDFLAKMNTAHHAGFSVIQGQRLPKNTNNSLSVLDGVSEAISNHVYRKGSIALGLSSSISGSGISFEYQKLKKLLSGMDSVGGFDRELELKLLDDGVKVYYLNTAKILDEKVVKTQVFENQRRRWISSQYFYLAKYFNKGIISLLKGNITYFNSSILRNIQLPRLINIGLLFILTILFYFTIDHLYFKYLLWPLMLGILFISIMISIPRNFYNKNLLAAIIQLPSLFFRMFVLLFKLKGANKIFIHTPHDVEEESVN